MKKTLLLAALVAANFCLSQTFSSGGLSTGANSKSGAAAPAGYTWSELQNDAGNTTETNSSFGISGTYNSATASFFLADDFIIPAGGQWQISKIDFFAYQTGYTGTTAPFNTVRVNIYSSDPSVAGAVSVYGDDTTNRFSAGVDAGMYRIGNTSVPSTVTTPATNRKIWKITANTPVTLNPGTYWIKYQLQNVTPASGGFLPSVTIVDSRGLASFNAKQFNAVGGTWVSILDDGLPTTAPDVPVDMPFIITYTTSSLGTKETMQYDNRVQVYPNPVKDHFKINNPERMKISAVDIIDASGKMVRTLKGSEEYSVSDLPKGSYILKIYNDGGPAKITKLIKQ